MDIVSHGLWGGVAFGQQGRKSFWWSFFFGVAPDLFSFGIYTVLVWIGLQSGVDWSEGLPPMSSFPDYVPMLYNVTHSLLVFILTFAVVWWWRRRAFLPLLAWALHIVMDIFTHGIGFFPTPWLWPLSDFHIDGIAWSTPAVFLANWILLASLYGTFFVISHKKRSEKSQPRG